MRESSIPPDWRIKAALAALPYVHSKPERSPATDPAATDRLKALKAGPIVTRCRKPSMLFVEEIMNGAGSKGRAQKFNTRETPVVPF
jgi:hypothetical protein